MSKRGRKKRTARILEQFTVILNRVAVIFLSTFFPFIRKLRSGQARAPPVNLISSDFKLIGGVSVDGNHPKRRKDKYNPYSIYEKAGSYFLSFKDGQAVERCLELDEELYVLFNEFELADLSWLNEIDRHRERFEQSENNLHERACETATSVEDTAISHIQNEQLHKAIAQLTEIQGRRLSLYYFAGLNYAQIAELEGCTARAVEYSVEAALKNLRTILNGK